MDAARQQIVDSIKANSNILVSVSTDPTVDELSAAIGLTILLNNLEKRSTAVFSGTIPAAINFLEPEKTFEDSADSLRDFIIALDKEKADHLRYKVEGDVVKIFITPYRTKLSQSDLDFSQGDYNVELVIGLGVKDQNHLDKALESHGKILHDAAVVTITAGTESSNLGSTDWHDETASSLSEMIVSLSDGLKGDKSVLDEQISTALLTGIVSSTDRFSNERTSSRVMTMAAQLMAAGANQQLIAAKLEEAHDIAPGSATSNNTLTQAEQKPVEHGSELTIERSDRNSQPTSKEQDETPELSSEPADTDPEPFSDSDQTQSLDQLDLEKQLADITAVPSGTLQQIEEELRTAASEPAVNEPESESQPEPVALSEPFTAASDSLMPGFEPTEITLPPATIETPELIVSDPQIVNEHSPFNATPIDQLPPINSAQGDTNEGEETVDPFNEPINQAQTSSVVPDFGSIGTPQGAALLASEPVTETSPQPDFAGIPELPPLPPLPFDAALPPLPPPPPSPLLPNFDQPANATMSGAVSGDIFGDAVAPEPSASPVTASEPGQFKIPGS